MNREAIISKYIAERDKRLREDGSNQYIDVESHSRHDGACPDIPLPERETKRDHVGFAFVGGGFAGLVTGARLAEAGIADVRIVEKGGDFGGTWYWNRYPGAQCDTASMIYMPLLEETGHVPSEKYAHGPEILAQCQRIGQQYGLYEKALFNTEVTGLSWDDAHKRWIITTNRGDRFTADFIGIGTGPLHIAKLPAIPGLHDFSGHHFHTSRWDYAYTGGSPDGAPMTLLADKRIAVIGTGATGVQVVPRLAKACKELFVIQRTPSSVDVRANTPIDPAWFSQVAEPGWQRRWLENFTANLHPGSSMIDDLVGDGWTMRMRLTRERMAALPADQRSPEAMAAIWEDTDFETMERIRARTDAVVRDKATADNLKAWYRQICKRPCFHDAYLDAFNTPGVHLIDTQGKGVERITEDGFVAAGKQFDVDCIIFASGFRTAAGLSPQLSFDVTGRDGVTLSEVWRDGMKSKHGTHVHGFPNLFVVTATQGANLIANIPHNLSESARAIAKIVAHARHVGARTVEVTQAAQDEWVALMLTSSPRLAAAPDCTPGYYNNEGQTFGTAAKLAVGYPEGPLAYFRYLEDWAASGAFAGLSIN